MRLFHSLLILPLLAAPVAAQEGREASPEGQVGASVEVAPDTRTAAEKRSDELDMLFGQLKREKPGGPVDKTQDRIWELWMKSDSITADLILRQATAALSNSEYEVSEEMLNQLLTSFGDEQSEVMFKRALLYFLSDKLDKAMADLDVVIELEPRHFAAWAGRGTIYARQGKLTEALAAYRQSYAINPHLQGVELSIKQLERMTPGI